VTRLADCCWRFSSLDDKEQHGEDDDGDKEGDGDEEEDAEDESKTIISCLDAVARNDDIFS